MLLQTLCTAETRVCPGVSMKTLNPIVPMIARALCDQQYVKGADTDIPTHRSDGRATGFSFRSGPLDGGGLVSTDRRSR